MTVGAEKARSFVDVEVGVAAAQDVIDKLCDGFEIELAGFVGTGGSGVLLERPYGPQGYVGEVDAVDVLRGLAGVGVAYEGFEGRGRYGLEVGLMVDG